jgi:hypothetical protein
MEEDFNCPMMDGRTQYGKAHWEKAGDYHRCTHCGSIHPDEAIQAVKDFGAGIIGATYKPHKRYINLPGVKNAQEGPIKFYLPHFTDEQRVAFNSALSESREGKS